MASESLIFTPGDGPARVAGFMSGTGSNIRALLELERELASDGQGPFRVVVPQKVVGPPDQQHFAASAAANSASLTVARLIRERVAELTLNGSGLAGADRIARCFPEAARTGQGMAIPLKRGLTLEGVLATCREIGVAVAGSKIRYGALEDILVRAAERSGAHT